MRTIRCQRCKQMFNYEGLPPDCCPLCTMMRAERTERVREILWDNPGITAIDVHNRTGVPINVILDMIERGDLIPQEEIKAPPEPEPVAEKPLPLTSMMRKKETAAPPMDAAKLDAMHAKSNAARYKPIPGKWGKKR